MHVFVSLPHAFTCSSYVFYIFKRLFVVVFDLFVVFLIIVPRFLRIRYLWSSAGVILLVCMSQGTSGPLEHKHVCRKVDFAA